MHAIACPSGAGLEAQLHGDLVAILEACAEADPMRRQPASLEAGCQVSMVAGAGFGFYRTMNRS
ncbi:Recombinase [Azospirillum largimobile]